MVTDKDGKPRGYAFIEYDRERDMNGKKRRTFFKLPSLEYKPIDNPYLVAGIHMYM